MKHQLPIFLHPDIFDVPPGNIIYIFPAICPRIKDDKLKRNCTFRKEVKVHFRLYSNSAIVLRSRLRLNFLDRKHFHITLKSRRISNYRNNRQALSGKVQYFASLQNKNQIIVEDRTQSGTNLIERLNG